jgi:glycosyltransferase involved in cell wall biosynthesis
VGYNFDQKAHKIKQKLKILVIIHGFPPYYMAGSEVYAYNKCTELSKRHEVFLFTRIEDEFQNSYKITESFENGIKIIRVNKPERDYTFRSKYQDFRTARIFREYLIKIQPDIVHINHLSHLTTLVINIIKKYQIPIIFTLHDYWMMCIRGQLIRDDYSICTGPDIEKCKFCNLKYFNSEMDAIKEIRHWLHTLSDVNEKISLFIAPSKFLKKMYIKFGIPENKIIYMDYGFDKDLINGVLKTHSKKVRFGFLGRIIPVKGVSLLIDAFNKVDHRKAELYFYGKIPYSSMYLRKRCKNSAIYFKGDYNYNDIAKVLSNIDVLVVPSIWYENSPLVIHEAFLAKIPVITSNLGGMAELVTHEKNGLLFEPGNVEDLIEKMSIFIENPNLIERYSNETYVRSIQEDVEEIVKLYVKLLRKKGGLMIAY